MSESVEDLNIEVDARFLESGNQIQNVFIGLEPAILVQPEWHEDEGTGRLLLTAVDLTPSALMALLDILKDAVQEVIDQQDLTIRDDELPDGEEPG